MLAPHSIARINQVLTYIENNLDQDLSLEKISRVCYYSGFHLHRLFKATIGETLNHYVTRKRIEKIALCLMHDQEISVTHLSLQYGFSSLSTLSRAFTNFYGVSPTQFRSLLPGEYRKICKTESKIGQAAPVFEQYICSINNCLNYVKMNATIEIKELPAMNVAYHTCIGVDALEQTFDNILQWARRRQLLQHPDFLVTRIFHDSFRITAPDKVRMSIGVILPPGFTDTGDEVSRTTIEKGRHIVARFLIEPAEFGKSWESLIVWMNENGYKKAPRDPFELFHNDYRNHPEKKCIVDLCIPVE